MTDLIYEMGRLITHAAETHQTPTEFVLGDDAYSLLRIVMRADMAVLSNQAEPAKVFGVPVRRDIRLPRSRVVLKAGQNTVGAVSVTQ